MLTIRELISKNQDIASVIDAQFEKARKCHDWRNYIPDEVQEVWRGLSAESKVMAYLVAEVQARQENWD